MPDHPSTPLDRERALVDLVWSASSERAESERTAAARGARGKSLNERMHRSALDSLEESFAEQLREVATSKDAPPSARVSAAVALLDRGYGKPPQAIDAKVTAEASPAYWHLEALKELAERAKQSKLARQAQEAMIDVTPGKPPEPFA